MIDAIVIGSGKRVQETALPAMQRLREHVRVVRVLARTAKTIVVDGARHDVEPIERLDRALLASANLVYVAVGKDAVPKVLARLTALDPRGVDLLIDTPVVRFKHFRHARKLEAFRRAWVAEDCIELPWIECVRAVFSSGAIGEPRAVEFDRSAYAYHAFATAKAILGATRVRRARRRKHGAGAVREIALDRGLSARVIEPRDYAVGRVTIRGSTGSLADHDAEPRALRLEVVTEGSRVVGFRAGDVRTALAPEEIELASSAARGASVIARTEAMKRVGFQRLIRRIASGAAGYSIEDGLEDMVVDYHLEKLGFYASTPLSSPRSTLARWLLSSLSRAGG